MEKVEHLLRRKFYDDCAKHERAETRICKDCLSDPFCDSCLLESEHQDHELLQVFKASRKEAIRVGDIEKFWNVSDVQPFAINGRAVVYIHERETKGEPGCRICGGHKLDKRYAFCSIECKFGSLQIEGNGDLNFNKRFSSGDKSVDSGTAFSSSSSYGMHESTSSSDGPRFVKRGRKGQPIRAPLF